MSPISEEDQESDSSSYDVDCFGAVCDPSLEGVYLNTKDVNVEDLVAPIECVTGDVDIDSALKDVKKACRNLAHSRSLSAEVPPTVSRSTRTQPSGPSYLLARANSILDRRIIVQPDAEHKLESSAVASNTHVLADEEVDFQLLPDVSVSSRADVDVQPQVSPTWLRKLQRRHGFTFFHPDEEECLEERCKEVAISAEFIAKRGLAIPYAEHRNVNPKKLIRIQLPSTGSNQKAGDTKPGSNSTSVNIASAKKDASDNSRVNDASSTQADELDPKKAQKLASSCSEESTKQNKGTSSKKNKARKRGLKKRHKRAKLSTAEIISK
ncbi:hypothetical protein FHG87_010667 [Trinorchestia longiramus]|nr:hypothetical protein FHG87_010667 [Trinorchestia longiramus]